MFYLSVEEGLSTDLHCKIPQIGYASYNTHFFLTSSEPKFFVQSWSRWQVNCLFVCFIFSTNRHLLVCLSLQNTGF